LSAYRYLPLAQNATLIIPAVLAEHSLEPRIERFVLTETEEGAVWLFVVLNHHIEKLADSYAANSVLADLSSALHGRLVFFSKFNGLRFAVLLSSYK
jgi:hypothetical protein